LLVVPIYVKTGRIDVGSEKKGLLHRLEKAVFVDRDAGLFKLEFLCFLGRFLLGHLIPHLDHLRLRCCHRLTCPGQFCLTMLTETLEMNNLSLLVRQHRVSGGEGLIQHLNLPFQLGLGLGKILILLL